MKIIDIEGIGEKYAKKLEEAGYAQVEDLIPLSRTEINELAEETGISEERLDKWQEHADMMRIHGIGPEYSEALNEIGIDSTKELANRNPENTLERIQKLDEEKPDVIRRLPTLEDIEEWIQEAKKIG